MPLVNRFLPFRVVWLSCLLLLLTALNAGAWWDQQWEYRKKIHFDTMAAGVGETLSEVPVLVRLHLGNFDFSSAKEDGSDLRFVDIDDQTPLSFHIEKYDSIDEIAFIWVKLPRLTGNSAQNAIWMYYGNQAAAAGQDSGATYDVNQLAVYHFGELEGFPRDATAYANHVGNFSGSSGLPAVIGNGMKLNGMGDHLVVPRTPSMNLKNGLSFSLWIRIEEPSQRGRLLTWDDERSRIEIELDGDVLKAQIVNGRKKIEVRAEDAPISPGVWTHVAISADPQGSLTLFVNGKSVAAKRMTFGVPTPESDPIIGAATGGENEFIGDIDEINLAGVPRSQAWISSLVQAQGQDGVLVSYGDLEEGEGKSASSFYILTVASNITIDGWVIISILLILGAWGTMIFIIKAYVFRQMVKENRKFLTSFKSLTDLISLNERADEFSNSPLFRIYSAGCEDLNSWLEGQQGVEEPKLGHKALNIFKTVVESGYMEQNRRVNSGLVVLVMTISGGPFLGLLGTVWGVMNTFAAMAAAGEANIMAIAPGVASALATTVFGLIVAIPALFSYNFLSGRVKLISADMGMFVDNFINVTDQVYGRD